MRLHDQTNTMGLKVTKQTENLEPRSRGGGGGGMTTTMHYSGCSCPIRETGLETKHSGKGKPAPGLGLHFDLSAWSARRIEPLFLCSQENKWKTCNNGIVCRVMEEKLQHAKAVILHGSMAQIPREGTPITGQTLAATVTSLLHSLNPGC